MKNRLASIFMLIVSGCSRHDIAPTAQPSAEKLLATTESIQRNLVNVSCVSCHSQATAANRNVALLDISKLIETGEHVHGKRSFLIKPGCPKQSLFLSIMKEGKMPPLPANRVSKENLHLIEEWIVSLNPLAGKACEGDDEPGGKPEPGEPGEPD